MKDLKSITDPAAGSEARRQEGPEAAHAFSGFEPMTVRQLHSVTVSADQRPPCRLVGQFRRPWAVPAGYRLPPGTASTSRMARMPLAVALSTLESPAHRWCDPVQWALRAHCNGQQGRSVPVASSGLVPSQAVSRRLRPSSTVPVIGRFMLVL